MLRIDSKNVSFNGVSIINDVQVVSMSANISQSSSIYFNINIDNLAVYTANSVAADADVEAFKEAVLDAV